MCTVYGDRMVCTPYILCRVYSVHRTYYVVHIMSCVYCIHYDLCRVYILYMLYVNCAFIC